MTTLLLMVGEGVLGQTQTFFYTGSEQTFTVPAGVTCIKVEAIGAGGGGGNSINSNSSGGGYSGIFINSISTANAKAIAGGGGGNNSTGNGGNGGNGAIRITFVCDSCNY